jgi:hypothetical protein
VVSGAVVRSEGRGGATPAAERGAFGIPDIDQMYQA